MDIIEFIGRFTICCDATQNVRAATKHAFNNIAHHFARLHSKINPIITLIQNKINEGYFCDKNKDYLLLNNIEPLSITGDEGAIYFILEIAIKPIPKHEEVADKPLTLIINERTGALMNLTQMFRELNMMSTEDILQETPLYYGNCHEVEEAACCYPQGTPQACHVSFFANDDKGIIQKQKKVSFNSQVKVRRYSDSEQEEFYAPLHSFWRSKITVHPLSFKTETLQEKIKYFFLR